MEKLKLNNNKTEESYHIEDDPSLSLLIRKINKERGLDCTQYRISYIQRRVMTRLRANQLDNVVSYLRFLDKNPGEYNYLINALTINVTNFFRDESVYRLFKSIILPKIISKKKARGQRIIRIWSAGCSSGEEPYSIAMIIKDVLGVHNRNMIITILATDYDIKSLEIARKGIYAEEKLKNVDEKHRRRYFKEGELYEVKPEIKKLVKFKNLDLFADNPIKYVDIIFCRNVLIYFTRAQQQILIKKYYDSLIDEGYLVLGKSEKLVPSPDINFAVVNGPERIYQKISITENLT